MSEFPKFSLCYTTVRPAAVWVVVNEWLALADRPKDLEFCVSFDAGDLPTKEAVMEASRRVMSLPSGNGPGAFTWVENSGPKNSTTGWNLAATQATGDVLIMVADDFKPFRGWQTGLTQAGSPGWWEREHVVWVKDGYNLDLFTLSILTAKRYARFGYVFFPQYKSLFSDTEFTFVAKQDHIVIDARHLLFEHMHPDCGKRERDASDLVHASTARWQFGETLFNYRLSAGFPMDDGPVALQRTTQTLRYAVVVQAIRDDLCLEEVVRRVIEENEVLYNETDLHDGIGAIYLFCPDTRWDGKPADGAERAEVAKIAERLNRWMADRYGGASDVPHVHYVPFRVADVANQKQERIMTETECRNWYQRYCLEHGFEHCLIVDGDELWQPGLLAQVNDLVRERWPMSIYTGMIPVAGLPGYPIEGAMDKATIYAPANNTFEHCRGAWGFKHELPGYPIYHFSAVRRTLQEIAEKHLNSGHYGDQAYEFDRWIKEVLPLIGPPGSKGGKERSRRVHMWHMDQPENVWPSVRNFTHTEWAQLPDSVKPYLGVPV